MRIQSLALLAGATATIAAETVTLFLPGFDPQEIVGKVIGTSASTTTYLIECGSSVDYDDCGIPADGMTVAQGSSTVSLGYSTGDITIAESCKYDSTSAKCGATFNEAGTTSAWTSTVALTDIPGSVLMPVTITGTEIGTSSATTGASVSASTATSTTAGTLTTSASTSDSTATGTSTGTSTASDSSDSSNAAATSQTATGNAAMPMITGNAHWAAGGVAAALALAAL